jgi:hypothetical protein
MESFKDANITTARTVGKLASVQVLQASRKRLHCVRQRPSLACTPHRHFPSKKTEYFDIAFNTEGFLYKVPKTARHARSLGATSLTSACTYPWISAIDL